MSLYTLSNFTAPVGQWIDQVASQTQYAPEEYIEAAVGLRFVSTGPNTSVPVSAMRDGVIVTAAKDRDPQFMNRFELTLSHDDGSSSYYGIIADWSTPLQQIFDQDGLGGLVGVSVKQGDLLGEAREASPIWLRLGLIDANGQVRSPVEDVVGFVYTNDVEVGSQY